MILGTVLFLIAVVIVVWKYFLKDELRDMFEETFNGHHLD